MATEPVITDDFAAPLEASAEVDDDAPGRGERTLLLSWAAFATTFGIARGITHYLHHKGKGGAGGIVIRGRHIHHYTFGIAVTLIVGGVGIQGDDDLRLHPLTAIAPSAAAPTATTAHLTPDLTTRKPITLLLLTHAADLPGPTGGSSSQGEWRRVGSAICNSCAARAGHGLTASSPGAPRTPGPPAGSRSRSPWDR